MVLQTTVTVTVAITKTIITVASRLQAVLQV
jgi:hypothetical protein